MIVGALVLSALTACQHSPGTLKVGSPGKASRPLLVLMELNPWLMVIGSDSPSLALYEDGRVIYLERDLRGRGIGYRTAVLSLAAVRGYMRDLQLERLEALQPRYEVSGCTDMPTYTVITFSERGPRAVSVYGAIGEDPLLNCTSGSTPPEFLRVLRRLQVFSAKGSSPWVPEVAEMLVWPRRSAPGRTPWPAHWPDLEDAQPKQSEQSLSRIIIDGKDLPALQEYLNAQGQFEAIVMNGQEVSVSYRYVFPGEDNWKRVVPRSH